MDDSIHRPPRVEHRVWPSIRALLFVVPVLFTAIPARGADAPHGVRWLVAAQDHVIPWTQTIAAAWTGESSPVVSVAETWPPHHEDLAGSAFAYLSGEPPATTIHLVDAAGDEILRPLTFEETDVETGRMSVICVLRGILEPLGIDDGGWPPTDMPRDEDTVERAGTADALLEDPPSHASRIRFGLSLGMCGRRGIDTPSFEPSVHLSVRFARSGSWSFHGFGGIDAAILGRAEVATSTVSLDGMSALVGLEIRPSLGVTELPIHLGIGGHAYWVRNRDDPASPTLSDIRPAMAFGAGVSWPVANGVRIGARMGVAVDLTHGDPPILLVVHTGDETESRGVSGVSVGGQATLEFGGAARPR